MWVHPEEVHITDIKRNSKGKITRIETTPEYWEWREKGFNNPVAVRYPNGFYGNKECVCMLWENEEGKIKILDYIQGRKKSYCRLYIDAVKKEPTFKKLKKNFEKGESYQILDVDGPTLTEDNKDNFPYNTMKLVDGEVPSKCDWGQDGIGSIEANKENIIALLNDPKGFFGHENVLSCCLMGTEDDWLQ